MRMQNTTIKTTRVARTPSKKPTAIFIRSPSCRYDKIRAHTGADHSFLTLRFQDNSRRRLACRLIGLNGASPHACGGASHDVTHGRRKYHNPRKRFMACSLPKLLCGGGGIRSAPVVYLLSVVGCPCAPAARLNACGMYLAALFSFHKAISARESALAVKCALAGGYYSCVSPSGICSVSKSITI